MWSKLLSNLWVPHLPSVHHILHYIHGTLDNGFFCSASLLQLSAYAGVDRTGCPDTLQSTTRWYMFLAKSPISWKCERQATVSKSSAKGKY